VDFAAAVNTCAGAAAVRVEPSVSLQIL